MNGAYTFCTNPLAVIGAGSRRVCYRTRHPGLCAKFYRAPEQLPAGAGLAVRAQIRLYRFSRWLNINCREWRYHRSLRRRLPAELLAVFPERLEPIYSPRLGWGLVECVIANADGSPARKLCHELPRVPDPALRLRLYREAERLLGQFADHGVRFFDHHNLLLQWTGPDAFRLRVADLEPCAKELLPCLLASRFLTGCKVRRRARRFLARLRADLFTDGAAAVHEPRPAAGAASRFSPWTRRLARVAGLI